MAYFLLVVEGAHDAAFFGQLLRERNLTKVGLRRDVDSYWEKMIPAKFPADPRGRLDHVIKYPDIYESRGENVHVSVAITVAGGDARLIREFQAAFEILDVTRLQAVGIVSDADDIGVAEKTARLLRDLHRVSTEGTNNSLPGFPLTLPTNPGVAHGRPRVGIHIFPDNRNIGTLETVLLDCATTSYAAYCEPAIDFVTKIDRVQPANSPELELLRRGAGRHKASAAMIGNLLFPGYSLSVAIERGSWLMPTTGNEVGLAAARTFLDSVLS